MIEEIYFSLIINKKLVSLGPTNFFLDKYFKCFILKMCEVMRLPRVSTCLFGPSFQ